MDAYFPPGLRYDPATYGEVKLLWLDFESTGLNTLTKHVTEVSARFTPLEGSILPDWGFDAPIAQPESVLEEADDWVKEHQRETLNRSRYDPNRLRDYLELDHILSRWLDYFGSSPNKPTIHLAGNSVWFDRAFMIRFLPWSMARLHYRQVDVSSVRMFLEGAVPDLGRLFAFTKRELHRTADDVFDSIQQYGLYRDFLRRLAQQAKAHLSCPDDIRAQGWTVAVHNDYRLNGIAHTFWLFTKDSWAVKGEGRTDTEALNAVRQKIKELETRMVEIPPDRQRPV